MLPEVSHPFQLRRLIGYILATLLIVVLVLYILWQARYLLAGPQITLENEPPRVGNERIITLSGTAENISSITLNGRQIFTDTHGHFEEALVLETGYTIATIAATDRYGRTTTVTRPFVYQPSSIITE
jgi:hypothetical protein